ncbi:C2 calcium-dependent domain-containing protein 4C [Nematolebias whitei]|uniref:C2 calcium-dependent domain-containing protein 4C n=1 Tax=Nematolebias whitei TaxID=451745 RepID=UPI00189B1440|nr:C2 calcium-dependent domain-containing protein 4C [Nematolebias whitei]
MWVIGKIRERVESIPLELNRYMGNSEDVFFQPKTSSLSQSVHSNIITPDNIPNFCLPPRLCKRSPPPEDQPNPNSQNPKSSTSSAAAQPKMKDVKSKKEDASEPWKVIKKPLPFSAEGYGLAGIYESPNTRRKESLFHSKAPGFMFDRSIAAMASGEAKERTPPKKTFSGFLPLFSCKSLSETGNAEGGTPSSAESLPFCSSYSIKPSNCSPTRSGCLKETKSCPSLLNSFSLASPYSPPTTERDSLNLSPPVLLPLDTLQCQERLQLEHVLPLQGRGMVRLSAEQTAFSGNTFCTVRVRLVCVEGLSDDEADRQALNCTVSLCLTPGKLQQQESATVRNCWRPVFNEDFFFTELRHKDLQELQLRLKVVNKPAAGTLRRGKVIGTVTKPLIQLLPVQKHT